MPKKVDVITLETTGDRIWGLEESFDVLKNKLSDALYKEVIAEIGDASVKMMRIAAPIRLEGYIPPHGMAPRQPGTLRDGIQSSSGAGNFNIWSQAIDPWYGDDYAPTQEYGYGVTPQPYFHSTLDHIEEQLEWSLEEFLEEALETDKVPDVKKYFGLKRWESAWEQRRINKGVRDTAFENASWDQHDQGVWHDELPEQDFGGFDDVWGY